MYFIIHHPSLHPPHLSSSTYLYILITRDYGAPPTIFCDRKAEDKYLKLEHLGMVLRHLSEEVQGTDTNVYQLVILFTVLVQEKLKSSELFLLRFSKRAHQIC